MAVNNNALSSAALGALAAIGVVGAVLCSGPAGMKTTLLGWTASAYGSDWLIVQYAQSGCVITHWNLKNEAVQNEDRSDGIYFVTEEGAVVHLSGHYAYVQNPTPATEQDLLSTGRCAEPTHRTSHSESDED